MCRNWRTERETPSGPPGGEPDGLSLSGRGPKPRAHCRHRRRDMRDRRSFCQRQQARQQYRLTLRYYFPPDTESRRSELNWNFPGRFRVASILPFLRNTGTPLWWLRHQGYGRGIRRGLQRAPRQRPAANRLWGHRQAHHRHGKARRARYRPVAGCWISSARSSRRKR